VGIYYIIGEIKKLNLKHMTKRPNSYRIHYHRYTLQFKFIPELIDRVNEDNWDVRKPLRSFLFIRSLL
jgi:hypothetical protein